MEKPRQGSTNNRAKKKGRRSLLSLYGYTLCLLLLAATVFGLAYSGGGANLLKEEEQLAAEAEAAAIEAAKPTPTPRVVSSNVAGRLIPYLENNLWG